MKKVKNYIEPELAKKKIARYKFWSIKDEAGITICSSDDNNPDDKTFSDVLESIIKDNVDAEVSVKYGTTDQSARQNQPIFIRINETIEWIEPEDETVQINGVPHKVDKNGNVNINLTTPEVKSQQPKVEHARIDTFRQEMEFQLEGIRREHQLKEERMSMEMQNKLMEQTLKFSEMMLKERETRILEREQILNQREAELNEKEQEVQEGVKSYLKQVPNALGGLIKDWVKDSGKKKDELAGVSETPIKKKKKVRFEIQNDEEEVEEEYENETDEELQEEIRKQQKLEEQEENNNQTNTKKDEEL